jgi:hypothetical protein
MINRFTHPNYQGELFVTDRKFPSRTLQLLGVLGDSPAGEGTIQGFDIVNSTEFAVAQTYAIPAHAADRSKLEGQAAPADIDTGRAQTSNVLQVWQEAIGVDYTKLGSIGELAGVNTAGAVNPVQSEVDFQAAAALTVIKRNLNWTVINQTYRKPINNATTRRTRGFIEACTSTRLLNGGTPRAVSMALLDSFMESIVNAGGIVDGEGMVVAAGTAQLRRLNDLFRVDKLKIDDSRTEAGVRVRTVLTTFGAFNFYHEPDMPAGSLLAINFSVASIVGMPIGSKGILFTELLSKTGASERYQMYGELGLRHGPEFYHGLLGDLITT